MIQDIAPHIYDNVYKNRKPEKEDFALYIKDQKTLMYAMESETARDDKNSGYVIPTIGDLEQWYREVRSHAVYLFSIDDRAYYLLDDLEGEQPEMMEWQGTQFFRLMKPDYQAFAAITATQLWRWKENRRFCGHCGTATVHSEIERAYVCPQCGQIEYPKISPAVIVAITNGDKLLMSRYRDRPYGGYALIAGFVEIGESFEETVRREVLEEVGLKVKNVRYYKSQP